MCILILLIICALWDLKKKEIPILFLVLMGVIVLTNVLLKKQVDWWGTSSGMLVGVLCLLCSKYTKEAIGYGDSWLILELGIYLGGVQLLQVLMVASLIAGVVSLFCLWKRDWKRKTTLPFVPFLALAYSGVLLL